MTDHNFLLKYGGDAFDERALLRVPALLWLIVLYAVHPLLLLALGVLPKGGSGFAFLQGYVVDYWVVSALPAALVLAAWCLRTPRAGRLRRGLWHAGPWLLLSSLALHLAFTVRALLHPDATAAVPAFAAESAAVDLFAMTVLVLSERMRDTFRDYPA